MAVELHRSLASESPLDRAPTRTRAPLRIAAAAAVIVHAGAATLVLAAQAPLRSAPSYVRASIAELIEIPIEAAPAAEPEPEAEPPREPTPRLPRAKRSEPAPAAAAPAAARAASVLAQAPDDAMLDFGETIVQGGASSYAGGTTEAAGSSRSAVRDTRARAGGVEGARGDAARALDRSRQASLASGAQWDCPFPEEAEQRELDGALVTLRVRVSQHGTLEEAVVVRDPGAGFGREARRCARDKRWQPALDARGRPIAAVSLVNVRFSR